MESVQDRTTAVDAQLLMVGSCSSTYRLAGLIVKITRIDDDAEITQGNVKAMRVEANVYTILGSHDLIAQCLYISPTRDLLLLQSYDNGHLKRCVQAHGPTKLRKWAKQMIEAVEFIHSKGVRHSDIRLDQWLLDSEMNARLSDFNSSGYDECPSLGLQRQKALGNEGPSHFMPRVPSDDNSVCSDLFALGSALYELEQGSAPYSNEDQEMITERFALQEFPSVSNLTLGCIILGAWKGSFNSATEILRSGTQIWDQKL